MIVNKQPVALVMEWCTQSKTDINRLVADLWFMAHHLKVVDVARLALAQFVEFDAPFCWLVAHVDAKCYSPPPRTHRLIDADVSGGSVDLLELLKNTAKSLSD